MRESSGGLYKISIMVGKVHDWWSFHCIHKQFLIFQAVNHSTYEITTIEAIDILFSPHFESGLIATVNNSYGARCFEGVRKDDDDDNDERRCS